MLTPEQKSQRLSAFLNRMHIRECGIVGHVINQREFAERIGVDNASLSQWLRMIRWPSDENMYKLLLYFGDELAEALEMSKEDMDYSKLRLIALAWPHLEQPLKDSIFQQVMEAGGHLLPPTNGKNSPKNG